MIGLVIETSTERGVVAAFDSAQCLFKEELPFGIQNSHLLLSELQKKIKEKVLGLGSLSFIAVGIGPGSYTGIRVGATIAKTLAFVFQVPLIGICTLDAFIPNHDGVFASVIDAKIGGLYVQTGSLSKGSVEQLLKPEAYSLIDAAEILKHVPTIVTPNAEKIRPKLEVLVPEHSWYWQEDYPQVEHMNALAMKKMLGMKAEDTSHLELLYMRKTQAEIERELKKSDLS